MKTWKRMLGMAVVLAMALALMVGMSACTDNSTDPSDDPTGSSGTPAPAEGGVAYTFEGDYISTASDVRFHFVLEFAQDGTLAMTPGVTFLDVDDYQKTASGTWSVDANKTLKFTIKNEDSTFNNDYEVPLANGGYSFEIKLSLAGFTRPVTMTCVTEGYVPSGAAVNPGPDPSPAATEPEGDDPGTSYPANTMVLDFTPDTSEQLQNIFYCESGVWGPALGASGSYTPGDSDEVLFSWVSSGSGNYHLDFKADGTYEYQFTTVNVVENGTWTFTGWTMTVTTAKGNTFTAEITK